MRRWLLRIVLGVPVLLLVLVAVFVAWNWSYVRAFPAILPGFYAKEWCSCRYAMRQGDAYCDVYARQWLPISEFKHDEAAKRITVRALGVTRSASVISEREGCRLDP